nr:MAG TPA: hypothetical protein [Caudoviricetes sp.]
MRIRSLNNPYVVFNICEHIRTLKGGDTNFF